MKIATTLIQEIGDFSILKQKNYPIRSQQFLRGTCNKSSNNPGHVSFKIKRCSVARVRLIEAKVPPRLLSTHIADDIKRRLTRAKRKFNSNRFYTRCQHIRGIPLKDQFETNYFSRLDANFNIPILNKRSLIVSFRNCLTNTHRKIT